MYYDTKNNQHGMKHDPFKAVVVPRPIGWISSLSSDGVLNLAPYSFFNAVCDRPPIVMFSSLGRKDSLINIEETGEFVCNLATWDLREAMNLTSTPLPRGVNEMIEAGLDPAGSRLVQPPRVKASPCALECKWLQTVRLNDVEGKPTHRYIVFGQVIGVYIDEAFIKSFGVKGGDVEQFRSDIRANLERELKGALMNRLRREVNGFNESLQVAMERFNLNMPMIATLLMAKAVEALEADQPRNRSEDEEFATAAQLIQQIVKARARANERAMAEAVRFNTMPTGA